MGRPRGINRIRIDLTVDRETLNTLQAEQNMSRAVDEAVREYYKRRRIDV